MLDHMLIQALTDYAEKTALVHGTTRMSYRELYAKVGGFSAGLSSIGVLPSSRVALVLPNCPEFVVSYYAVARLHAIFVPLSPLLKEEELHFYIQDCAPGVIITDMKRANICQHIIAQLDTPIKLIITDGHPASDISFSSLLRETAASINDVPAPYQGDMVYHYSSGSTGRPKRVPRTQRNLFDDANNMTTLISLTSSDTLLCTVPLFHSYGQLLFVLMPICVGATLVLLEQYVQDGVPVEVPFAAQCPRVVELITQERVTFLPAVPYIFAALAEIPEETAVDLTSLRACFSAGSFLPRETFDRFRERFGIPIRQTYGTTEGGLIAANIELAANVIYDSVGITPPTINVKILDEDLREQPVGCIGEVAIKSSTLTAGYANLPALNREAFRNGYYLTGDLGKKDEKGHLYLTGRKKFLIDTPGGQKVDPIEIEDILIAHPKVADAAVIGVRGVYGDTELRAFIITRSSCTQEELLSYCRKRLADFKLPQRIEFRTQFPRSSLGKILREELSRTISDVTLEEEKESSLITRLLAAHKQERYALLEAYLCEILASMLRVPPAELDVQEHLTFVGLDSLMAIQLKHRLETNLGMSVSLVKLLQGLTISQISTILQEQLTLERMPALTSLAGTQEAHQEYSLSYGQSALWYIYLSDPKSAAHNTYVSMRILSDVDVAALHAAFQQLVDRHASLRTVYGMKAGKPVQRILDYMPVNFQEVKIAALSEEALHDVLVEASHRPFDLERESALRVHLFTGSQTPILLLTAHHIATDFWSMVVLMDELRVFYSAQRTQRQVDLAPQQLQYVDYMQWEARLLASPTGKQAQHYWQQQLAGELPVLNLPTDRLRPPVKTSRGARYFFSVDEELSQQLRQIARSESVTLYTLLLAAFQVLLSRYSGQNDFFVGSPTMIRSRTELQNLVGYLVNPVVLRACLADEMTFQAFLRQVSETVLAALEHQDFSFMRLVEDLLTERDPSRSPIFDVMFVLDRPQRTEMQHMPEIAVGKPDVQMNLGGLVVEASPLQQQSAQFDLSLIVVETEEAFSTSWEYNSDLFDETTIARMVKHFHQLLKSIVANPAQAVARLELLADEERRQLLETWNATQQAYPLERCIHQLIEEQAVNQPDAVAIVCEELYLTYKELNRRANQLAHSLQMAEVGPDVPVGVCAVRSAEMIIALLGILKAGGTYIPLDPAYPRERIYFMLKDAGTALLLTQQRLRESLSEYDGQILYLDEEGLFMDEELPDNPVSGTYSENLAYIIYTSGSTGQPKGVQVSHRGLLNLIYWHQRTYSITPVDRATQFAGISFDASVWEIWPYLAAGACLHLPDDATRLSPPRLRTWLATQGITVSFLPTPLAENVLAEISAWPENLALRALLTGGDRLHMYPSSSLPFALVNHYGPTEGAVVSSAGVVLPANEPARLPSIGRPIGNVQTYILDQHLQPVPVGVAGELYIAGAGLARGYSGRPALTAERFIANPYSQEMGARFYLTGDLVRYLPDGSIEYLDRVDHQVKVRGYRVELGEIETTIRQHPGVQEVVVLVREDVSGDKRLVAYLTADPTDQISADIVAEEQAKYIANWQELYERTYRESAIEQEGIFNIAGWNSSYTGEAIAEEAMREQVEQTVERILSLKPQRVLEIGCGTGLMLFRVAPFCQTYWGTDFSPVVLDWVRRQDAMRDLPQVKLLERVADDLRDLDSEHFDTVILNSVVQYFSSIEYLVGVLEQIVQLIEPGGKILLGDLRSFRHLEVYYSSVQLFRAADTLPIEQLRQRIDKYVKREEELLIDPQFFQALKEYLPQIGSVQVQWRRGHHHNEITRFRYDVILHIGVESVSEEEEHWEWQREVSTVAEVHQYLIESAPPVLRLSCVPNARLWHDVRALRMLKGEESSHAQIVGELRETLQAEQANSIDPEEWWQLGTNTGYSVEVGWSEAGEEYYEILFRRDARSYKRIAEPISQPVGDSEAWHTYANYPLRNKFTRQFVPQLSAYLEKKLPEYMVPAAFVLLDSIPLTSNGKIDRRMLPMPDLLSFAHSATFVAPRTPIEQMLTEIVAELVGLEQVGIHDSFFELGGHSLLVMQLLSHVRNVFQVELPFALFFEMPTVANLAECIERERRKGEELPLMPVARGNVLPISFAQERLWFLDQLTADNPFYTLPVVIRLQGLLRIETFARSLQAVIQRHETLRTTFQTADGKPHQVIAEQLYLALPCVDLQGLPANRREVEMQKLSTLEMQQPFKLAQGPLLRARLLLMNKEEYVLLLVIHHIVSDGWSVGVFIRDLAIFYEALSSGKPARLPEMPVQYADFAAWQRQWLQGEVVESQLAYWKRQLREVPMLQLPTDRRRPSVQTFQGAHYPLQLSRTLTKALKALSQQRGVTLFMTLLAAFQLLLSRYTGMDDIAVGTGIANRNRREIEEMIGFFVNTLVLRTDLSGAPSFFDLLSRVRTITLEAYANQDLPFERLVAELHPERNLSYQPLFQVMFIFQNFPMPNLELSEVSISPIAIEGGIAKFDLTLSLDDLGQGLSGWFEYNTDLFDSATIARMVSHWQKLLEVIVAHPEWPVTGLPMVTETELQRLLIDYNATQTYLEPASIATIFEEQVQSMPDAIALVFSEHQVSYAELNRRANQLAHLLQRRGVEAEVCVGLYAERSIELMVGMLAILKVGGVYVPLDLASPHERIVFQLHDAHAVHLIAQQALLPLPGFVGDVLCIESNWQDIAQEPAENLPQQSEAESLAYVMYTSGSTGIPKGVGVPHRAIARLVQNNWFIQMNAEQIFLHLAPLAFDASTLEIWGALLHGARLVLFPDQIPSLEEIARVLQCQAITTLWLTAGLFHQMVDQQIEALSGVSQLLAGGDVLGVEQVRRLLQQNNGQRLINGYGPTENTTFTCCYPMEHEAQVGDSVSIGFPISNTTVYVLNEALQVVPTGVIGELYTGGAGLARGYLRQPALTAERFVPDPFSQEPGGRLYRTGDLVRYLPDGQLEFVGRADQQVKIRGFRIELGEIEQALNEHPDIRQAVVQTREEGAGSKRLVAYVVPETQGYDWSQVRAMLQERLPDYMVPTLHVELEAMPLTPNGKIDRRALPSPDYAHLSDVQRYVAPRTEIEQRLVEVWQQVLGMEQVGIHDNFFALGGDSILSIQLVARSNQFGLHIAPRHIFQYQTIAELVQGTAQELSPGTIIEVEQGQITGEVPLTPIQHWFFEQEQPEPQQWNQALLLTASRELDREHLQHALEHLIAHHDALRLRFSLQNGVWQQVNTAADALTPFSVIDLSQTPDAEQQTAITERIAHFQASLNLAEGPLLRMVYFDLGTQQAPRLLMLIHHLVVDGVSWRILLEDLQLAYERLARGKAVQMPAKTSSFRQWAQNLQSYAQEKQVRQQLPYWQAMVEQPISPLPLDSDDGENIVASERTFAVCLTANETQALLHKVPQAYHTQINDVLLTALALTLRHWTGKSAHLINLEGHGREDLFTDIDLSRTVGWFTSLYPFQLQLEEQDRAPGRALKAIKEQLRSLPARGIGYGLLRYLCQNDELAASIRSMPAAEVSFNYLGQFDQVFVETGLFNHLEDANSLARNPSGYRQHVLDITGIVSDGQLQLSWIYSTNRHHERTIQALAQYYLRTLRELIVHCQSPESGGYTPSDFPLARLSQQELDALLGQDRRIEALYPLSPLQQGLLFQSLYAPGEGDYITQLQMTLRGQLHVQLFQEAWQQALQRHAILRTAFFWEGIDEAVQIVSQQVALPFAVYDWQEYSRDEQQARLQAYLQADRERGINLSQAPLMRLALVRIEEDCYECIWSHHHILLDGWSLPILLRDIFTCYEMLTRDEAPHWDEPARAYQNYIQWYLHQDISQAEAFWRHKLRGFTTPTPLGLERAVEQEKPAAQRYAEIYQYIPSGITQDLQRLARQQHLTLNTLVLGAWALLLSSYSAQDDIVFGTTVSGRSAEIIGIEQMVGLFINTLPMRVHLSAQIPLLAWLRAIQEQQSELRQYEYSRLAQVQGWSEVPRGQTLFDYLFVFENYPLASPDAEKEAGALHIATVQATEQTHYPLTLMALPGQQLGLKVMYDQTRFAAADVTRLLNHLQTILEGVLAAPEQPLGNLCLLTQPEQRLLLQQWHATPRISVPDSCLHQLFEAQVEQNPDGISLVWQDHHLSYKELDQRANQLAHYLRQLGIGPEALVGLCLERSPEMLIGLLGILKAGAAYVPIDPAYPRERIHFQLADAHIHLLLTQQSLLEHLPAEQASCFCLDAQWPLLAQQATSTPACNITTENLAYVIYTSGSTGRPKGVAIAHHSTVTMLGWAHEYFSRSSRQRVLACTSLCFDLSIFELFAPLCCGGTIVLVENALQLPDQAAHQHVTLLNTVPSAVAELLRAGEIPASVQTINLAGEALPISLVQQLYQLDTLQQVYNLYGPTEDTTYSTWALLERDASDVAAIGRPLPDTQVYVLDRYLHPVSVGFTGELYLAGAGLARGYLRQPALTAERFVPDPFSQEPGGRLYRTGDLVRYLPDGQLEFVGRADQQVKIRGFRIELGEIEQALNEHPGIRQAVVQAREEGAGSSKRLVAYVVPETQGYDWSQVRAMLQERLPDYMVPTLHVELEAMPLTPNGKIDRRALPSPDYAHLSDVQRYVAPRTEIEQRLVEVWQQVLGVEQVGIHDNFFALGGDSILSIQLISRARGQGLLFTPKQIFQQPTIAELANLVEIGRGLHAEQSLVTGPVPFTPIQRWFLELQPEVAHHWNQAMLLTVPTSLDFLALNQAIAALLAHHDVLRLRIVPAAEGWQQIQGELEDEVPLVCVDLSAMPPARQAQRISNLASEVQASLHLEMGPAMRVAYFNLGGGDGRILLVIHHMAIDGVSWRILLEDLQSAYAQLISGKNVQLPPKTTSFQMWSKQLNAYAQRHELQQELAYWLSRKPENSTRLPVDYVSQENSVAVASQIEVSLTEAETQALLRQVPLAYRTQVNDVLLTALARAFYRWTGERTLLLDLEGHGREDIIDETDISRTVGWFTSLYPVLLHLESEKDPGADLKSIKEQLRKIPQRGIGYGLLRYLSQNEDVVRELRAMATAEVSFNYLGQFDQSFARDGLFAPATEDTGLPVSPLMRRPHSLDINSSITGNQLHATWTYSTRIHRRETIESVAQFFIQALREIIAHTGQPDVGGYTPSDFPMSHLAQDQLDTLFSNNRQVENIYPLSSMQQGLLFHALYDTHNHEYITQVRWMLRGDLNIAAWVHAWQEVVDRHPILRTALLWQQVKQQLQVVYQHVTLPWSQLDWRAHSAKEQEELLKAYLQEDRNRGFDLSQAPLMRITIIQTEETTYECIWSHHHILLDGWSLPLVFNEVLACYTGSVEGRNAQLTQVRPYQDYILWLQQQNMMAAETYWRQTLHDFTLPTPFGIDRPRSIEEQTYAQCVMTFTPELFHAIQSLTRQYHLTANTLFQGAWALLLSRYSGQEDVVFGTTVAGRPPEIEGIEAMIGLFINTLPVRARLHSTDSMLPWLYDLQQRQIDTRQYEYSSLAEVQRWSEVPRGMPLFESLLLFESYPVDTIRLEESSLTIQVREASAQTNYPLTLIVSPSQQFEMTIVYETHRFERAAIQRMLRHFQIVLEEMAAHPSQPLSQISLLTAQERQLLRQWDTRSDFVGQETYSIQQLFEQQVRSAPTAIAVQCDGARLTYERLNEQANQLAHYLQTLGLQQGMTVGLYVSRSEKILIGMLGILKAGGICAPIDHHYPDKYVKQYAAATRVSMLITQQTLIDTLPAFNGWIVSLEAAAELIARQSTENVENSVHAQAVAYKLFSVGRCVNITYDHIYRHLLRFQAQVYLTQTDVVLQNSSISLESALWELCWPLLYGGKVVISTENEQASIEALQKVIAAQKVSVAHLTPSELSDLFTSPLAYTNKTLRTLLCSGSPLNDELVALCAAQPDRQFLYHYTTPETFTYLTIPIPATYESAEKPAITQAIPIRPIALLDVSQQFAPIGINGDLYVVVDQPAFANPTHGTALPEGFRENPFASEPGRWLFRTGQQAHYLDDGRIELVRMQGRTIWHKGYSVKLDTIQEALLSAPGVEECVVRSGPHSPELIAYIVTNGQFQIQRLRAHVSGLLPAELVPDRYIPVSILPLTRNGLVDEQQLSSIAEVSNEAAARWEESLHVQSGLAEQTIKALCQEYTEKTPTLHLSDLLSDWKDVEEEVRTQEPGGITAQEEEHGEHGQLRMAFSDGGPQYIPEGAAKTLTQALLETAARYKNKGIIYIQPDGSEDFQSYAALLHEARCILKGLQKIGLGPKDKAILQIETLREHFATFWACVLGGITPVTVAVAHSYHERNSVVNKLYNIWNLLDHPPIIARAQLTDALKGLSSLLPMSGLRVLAVDELGDNEPGEEIYPSQPEDVVFFQLTSGSTGIPKCIQETHRGIISHIHGAREFNGYAASNVSLNWLPVDHVVPILTCHLKDVYLGCAQIELKTATVLTNPLKWLDYIEKYRVTHTWSPNFGFKLVSDWLSRGTEKTWDLSSVQCFLNAGEQVTLPVVSEFLRLVEPFKVKPQAMQPSFGMAEACTCMTFLNNFDVKSGVHLIEKASLGGRLRKAREGAAHVIAFVDLGGPVPGVQIRITDKSNQVVPEGVIGRFQIKGAVITPGYYKNDAANEEAFVGDGWFNSGDLGFILDGRLTLTGREKEIIVINGANHYCYEIEDVVNSIPGVEPTFVGICGIADPRTGTEGLAIFFTPAMTNMEERIALIKTIRVTVTTSVGLNPLYIVPVEKRDFPKTTSGKIQRTQLKKSLQAGDFDEQLKAIDIQLENNNTLPDWFYNRAWVRRNVAYQRAMPVGQGATLLLLDHLGLGEAIRAILPAHGQPVVCIEAGETFARLGANHYRIDPMRSEHYREVVETMQREGTEIARIIHLWTYGLYDGEPDSIEQLEAAQHTGIASLLHLIQAAKHVYHDASSMGLYIVSSYTQAVNTDDPIALEKLSLSGLLKTIGQELSWLHCRQVDVPVADPASNAALVLQEVQAVQRDSVVAYRNGTRYIERLSKVRWEQERIQEIPLVQGGFYLLSGGLGGVAIEVARMLLTSYQARLLLIGRRPLPPRNTWAKLLADEDADALLIAGYLQLVQLGGEISYVAADICDPQAMQQAVQQAEERYGQPLHGIFHLAGTFSELLVLEETPASLLSSLRAKITGTWVLHQLVKDHPDSLFVTFSSVNGFFGGAAVGAYAAANSFLDTFVHYQRNTCGLQSYCFAWSMWDEVGISRGYHMKELTQSRGYYVISSRRALSSMMVGLQHRQSCMLIGLDGSNQYIRRYIHQDMHALQEMAIYVVSEEALQQAAWYEKLARPSNYYLTAVAELPVTEIGEVDVQKLTSYGDHSRSKQSKGEVVEARNELEQRFIMIWREVFGIATIGVHDNFFSLGGDSIVSIQVVAKANQAGIRLTTKQLLQHPTIAELVGGIDTTPVVKVEQGLVTGEVPLTPIQRWFFAQQLVEPHHWNMSLLLKVQQTIPPAFIREALFSLLQHHDALRMRFVHKNTDWRQSNRAMDHDRPFMTIDLSAIKKGAQAQVREHVAAEAQRSLDLAKGPLLRMIYFDSAVDQPAHLLVVVHHLVMDGVSWRILIEDLQNICQQLQRNQVVQLPAKTVSYKQWSEQLNAYAQTDNLRRELDYWLVHTGNALLPLPKDYIGGTNSFASMRSVMKALTVEETEALLYKVPEAYHTQINDVLLTALALTMREWTACATVQVNLEGHGREEIVDDVDISRTIGWFTDLYPVTLDLEGVTRSEDALKSIKEQLRKIPHKGIGYGMLRYLATTSYDEADSEKLMRLRALPEAEVSFNYLGQFDQTLSESSMFSISAEPDGFERSPAGARKYLLDIVGSVNDGQLRISWMYSEQIHASETILRLAEQYMQTLRDLIAHCQDKAVNAYTPSDFPLAALEQEELDMIVKKLNSKRGR